MRDTRTGLADEAQVGAKVIWDLEKGMAFL